MLALDRPTAKLSLLLFETYANASSYFRLHTSICTIGRKSPRALPILQRSPRKIVYVYILPIRYIWTAHFLHLSFAFTTTNHRNNMKCSARMSNGRPSCTARMSNGRPSCTARMSNGRPSCTARMSNGRPSCTARMSNGRPGCC